MIISKLLMGHKMIVIGGSSSKNLSKKIAKELDCEFSEPEFEKFPDGEIYVRLTSDVENEKVVIVQSTCNPPNQNYMELFLLLDAANDLGAEKISAVVPYFGYARQDKRFESGEAVSLETVSNLIECSGTDEIYMLDIHPQPLEQSPEVFDIPAYNLTAADSLARYIDENYSLESPVVFAPDKGAEEWAKKAGESIEADCDFMEKKRHGPETVEIQPRQIEVEGRDAIIVDDIISTGGTMREAINILQDHGANRVFASCTHPVLVGDALEKLRNTGVEEVIGTDTIEKEVSKVSVAPVISEAIR